jgi:putative Holliday junction resolvase
MGRLLGLDYGRKRVGVAVTDPERIIASGRETVSAHEIRSYLKKYLSVEKVDEVVVGYPRTLQNKPSEAVTYIHPFLDWFRKEFPGIPLVLYDERFTSKMAEDAIIRSGVPKTLRRDKSLVDKISAALILQSYLDSRKYQEENLL